MEEKINQCLERLQVAGCDINGALERVLGDTEFLVTCIRLVIDDEGFENLGHYLAEKQIKEAFEEAHKLKGIIANMGLSPLYDTIVKIVESLRDKQIDGLEPIYQQLISKKEELLEIIKV